MDLISEKFRAIQDLCWHNLAHEGLYWHIEKQLHNQALEDLCQQIEKQRQRIPDRKWKPSCDPNVPTEFKRKCLSLLQHSSRQKEKLLAVSRLIAAKNPDTLTNPLKESNHLIPKLYSLEANAICQFLRLAEEHHRLGKGPVTKGQLWNRVCSFHAACFKSGPPTHRAKILKKIGLDSLRTLPPGRPRKLVP
jgi:hypothetical protein